MQHKKINKVRIKCNSVDEKRVALALMSATFNLPISDITSSDKTMEYPYVGTSSGGGEICGWREVADRDIETYSLAEFANTFVHKTTPRRSQVICVRLNNDYTAEVSKDGIKVGCKTFPLSVVPELAEAVQKLAKTS